MTITSSVYKTKQKKTQNKLKHLIYTCLCDALVGVCSSPSALWVFAHTLNHHRAIVWTDWTDTGASEGQSTLAG